MERTLKVGDHVIFHDAYRVAHHALVTRVFSNGMPLSAFVQAYGSMPCVNVLWTSDDPAKTDPYGQQVERATSVVHGSAQPVRAGMYFLFPGEE